ncbi:MAG: flap endonuclease Xni [Gammaproteobacteria bacterium]|nr:flap endonuclease Xni [Gammaproteobacteria bacterium]MDE0280310.1 flap endonuclease Xni [Gammaproteobacteria bacterium]MXX17725.1 flap endonuclease Xni [Gammaproteobacteria bacterium]MYH91874.1 flap endonuclease Xni [Gammaproteobacteria bacterium]
MKALLIDGLNLVRRIYAAVPQAESGDREAHLQRAVSASVSSLERALRFHQPTHAVVVFETPAPTWRHQLYPDYKKNRKPMPGPLRDGIPALKDAFLEAGVESLERPGYEADDIIATIAGKIALGGGFSTILSTDRHYCQLLGEHIEVYDHFGQRPLDRDLIRDRLGIEPRHLPFFLALTGDSSKSIPGIVGVGPRTAARLVAEFGDLESLLEAAEGMTGRIGAKIMHGAESARTALALFRFKTDIALGINLNQLRHTSRR